MWEPHFLIWEFGPVDTLATSSVLLGNVSTLHHEVRDDAMEGISLVRKLRATLTSGKASEILNCFRHFLFKQFENDSLGLCLANLNVEVDLRIRKIKLGECLLYLGDCSFLLVV